MVLLVPSLMMATLSSPHPGNLASNDPAAVLPSSDLLGSTGPIDASPVAWATSWPGSAAPSGSVTGSAAPEQGAQHPDSPGASPTASASPGSQATPHPAPNPTPKPPPATPTPAPPQPPPGTNLSLGVWSGQPWDPGSLNSLKSLLGRNPSLFLTYVGWDRPFYRSDEQEIANRGASHVVTWEPNGYSLASIAAGNQDAFIRAWAQGAATWGGRIYLRPMHEMNGDWYPWGRGVNGNTPAQFVSAWKHMHDIFMQEGATNVKWVWSPNVRYGNNYPFADLYPGSAYVDWIGLDGYNWGLDHHLGQPSWQSFGAIFGATYREVTALAPGKPVMIAETASTENGGNKGQWTLQTFLSDIPKYPAIRAAIWFNQADGSSNFKIDSSAASLSAFKQVLSSAAWSAHLP